ncbi:MAG: PIN domain-containing protein [Bacteroidetes bacterium]|nr:PIN domain-containing protein [Bacteroidota bacterium]
MDKIFVDTNVVIDYLGNRIPFADSAEDLFLLANEKRVELYVSAASFDNIYYILRKKIGHAELIKSLRSFIKYITIVDLDAKSVINAVDSKLDDFEDALQHECALKIKNIKAIVTRDRKGFGRSSIPAMTVIDYLKTIN